MTTKHKHMLLVQKKDEEIDRKNARLGTLPGESPGWMPYCEICPRINIIPGISRGIRHARNPWKQKRQLTQPPNQPRKWTKHEKNNDNQTKTHASCWKEDGRNRQEECKARNASRREPRLNSILLDFPQVRNYSRGIRHARAEKNGWRSLSASMELFQLMSLWGCTNQCHALCIPQIAKPASRIPEQLHAKICQTVSQNLDKIIPMVW